MREKLLIRLAQLQTNHPWRMLIIVLVLTFIFIGLSTQLKVTLRWSDLLPENDPRTVQFNKIIDEFKSSTSLVVVVQGKEKKIKAFADYIAPRVLLATDTTLNSKIEKQIDNLLKKVTNSKEPEKISQQINNLKSQISKPLVQRVDYKREVDFIKNHGLMLMKKDDLDNIKEAFYGPNLSDFLYNLNNAMEKEYVGKSESISSREKEDKAFYFLDGIEDFVSLFNQAMGDKKVTQEEIKKTVDKFLIGDPYFISYDKNALILNVIPTFSMTDAHQMVVGTEVVQNIVDEAIEQFPGVEAGLSGMIAIGHDEMVYSEKSLGYTSLIAVVAILIMLVLSLRMWIAPIYAMLNLFVGIIWAMGVTVIFVGQLNLMTYMMTVILIGLGIDFSIHIISGFTEWRAKGFGIFQSLEQTYLKTGKGIITGAITTSFAFLSLIISSSRGMKEMGIVTGLGLVAILLSTFLFLPLLLIFKERRKDKKHKLDQKVERDISFNFLGMASEKLGARYRFTIIAAVLVTFVMLFLGSKLTFDHNYMNIEPKGLTSIALQDTVIDKFDLGMDYALILANNVEESRNLSEKYRSLKSVAMTEDMSAYLPSEAQQTKRKLIVDKINKELSVSVIRNTITFDEMGKILTELDRLNMNIIEVQDMAFIGGQDKVDNKCKILVGDPEKEQQDNELSKLMAEIISNKILARTVFQSIQTSFAPYFKTTTQQMTNTNPIEMQQLPESILDRYTNKSRDKFLVTVFPAGNIWQDSKFLNQFVDDLESGSAGATGMPPVFRALIEVIGKDGRNAIILTLLVVFVLLWIDFGKYKLSIIAMIPLAIGIIWMAGLMYLTGQQLTVMNFMGLPMIVGIGIDDGVHIVHRWQTEGRLKLKTIFASTGKAIFLTSLTTMIAFGSLTFSIYRGFGQLGNALFVGVGSCFIATVTILPAIIYIMDKNKK
jgi:uncharacterized protein